MTSRSTIQVVVEQAAKRSFASALAWPGWCRSGRSVEDALDNLAAYAERYAPVAALAGARLPAAGGHRVDVVEVVHGAGATEFGVPSVVAAADRQPVTRAQATRMAALVEASWTTLASVVAAAPPSLRKGPRGGGRDRDAIALHVVEAEEAYARKLGVRVRGTGDAARDERRVAMLAALRVPSSGEPVVERGWPPRYAARRIAWHALDHAWEIEDRSET